MVLKTNLVNRMEKLQMYYLSHKKQVNSENNEACLGGGEVGFTYRKEVI